MPASSHARPDREAFRGLGERWPMVPVWTELLADSTTPVALFSSISGDGPGVLLESVERSERWGRYSFVAGDPAAMVVADESGVRLERVRRELPNLPALAGQGALQGLKAVARALTGPRIPDLPPLAGGLVGYLAYEAAGLFDGHPYPSGGRVPCPPIGLMVADRAIVFDHWRKRLMLIAHVPAAGPDAYDRALEALDQLEYRVGATLPLPVEPVGGGGSPIRAVANIDGSAFRASVRRTKEQIAAGEIFQAVLSRRLTTPAPRGALTVYRQLRVTNPSPYMFFLRAFGVELAGSSPEPLVQVHGRRVTSRPIAGTRPRGASPVEDERLERELLADRKERAEHAMLVDLARNDLGRVCTPGSVAPTELMTVERFSRVMHIVSTVEGELAEGLDPLDALAATFPAGTVTGAPKRRAMEIIAQEEPLARGPYAGAVGSLSFAGDLDFCITIRTALVTGGSVHVQAGAGIVADSDPERELLETEAKASAVLAAVGGGRP